MAIDLNSMPQIEEDDQYGHGEHHDLPEDEQVAQPLDLNTGAFKEEEAHAGTVDGEQVGHSFHLNFDAFEEKENMADDGDEEELEDSHDGANLAMHENGDKYKNMTDKQRRDIYEELLARSDDGKLKKDTTSIIAEMLNFKKYAVQAVCGRVKQCRAQGIPVDVSSRKPKNCGRKKVEIDLSGVASIPLNKRSTIRSLGESLGVQKSTLRRWFKQGMLWRHSNALKPNMKEANKRARLLFCVSMLNPHTVQTELRFIDMRNIVHLDEKWFNTTKKVKNFYMLPEENDPLRTVHNKNAIDKVMFLLAVARPRYDQEGQCTFNGKIGIWPFIY